MVDPPARSAHTVFKQFRLFTGPSLRGPSPKGTAISVEFKDLIPVQGVLRDFTDSGFFLLVQNRTVFLDAQHIPLPLPRLMRGETLKLQISRDYARRKGFVV